MITTGQQHVAALVLSNDRKSVRFEVVKITYTVEGEHERALTQINDELIEKLKQIGFTLK